MFQLSKHLETIHVKAFVNKASRPDDTQLNLVKSVYSQTPQGWEVTGSWLSAGWGRQV